MLLKSKNLIAVGVGFAVLAIIGIVVGVTLSNRDPESAPRENVELPIAARLQWIANGGYCGEVSFIAAGLHYGMYMSQYDVRDAANNYTFNQADDLIIGEVTDERSNDKNAARYMHLNFEVFNTDDQKTTEEFLVWIKQQLKAGNVVVVGVMYNMFVIEELTDPNAGDVLYDHVVPVIGYSSEVGVSVDEYDPNDWFTIMDNGFYTEDEDSDPQFFFTYSASDFPKERNEANDPNGPIYSIANQAENYAISLTGIVDKDGYTMPVEIQTSINYEIPELVEGSSTRPAAIPLTLTVTVSELQPGVDYVLYRYNSLALVPESGFNAKSGNAEEIMAINISSGSTYSFTVEIVSSDTVVFRCVPQSAP